MEKIDFLKKGEGKISKLKFRLLSSIVLSLFLFNVTAEAKQFQMKNATPTATVGANVLHKKKLDINVLTDYTDSKSQAITTKLNKFRNDMAAKSIDVNFNVIDGTDKVLSAISTPDNSNEYAEDINTFLAKYLRDESERIMIHISDGVGEDLTKGYGNYFSLSNLTKVYANSIISKAYSIYAITPSTNWDYKSKYNTQQDITIKQMVNASPVDSKLYDSSSTGGLTQLDSLIGYLTTRYSSNIDPLFDTTSTGKNIDIQVLSDFQAGTVNYNNLVNKVGNIKPSLYPYGVNFQFDSNSIMNDVLHTYNPIKFYGFENYYFQWNWNRYDCVIDKIVLTDSGDVYSTIDYNFDADHGTTLDKEGKVFKKLNLPPVKDVVQNRAYIDTYDYGSPRAPIHTLWYLLKNGDVYYEETYRIHVAAEYPNPAYSFTVLQSHYLNLHNVVQMTSDGDETILFLTSDGKLYGLGDPSRVGLPYWGDSDIVRTHSLQQITVNGLDSPIKKISGNLALSQNGTVYSAGFKAERDSYSGQYWFNMNFTGCSGNGFVKVPGFVAKDIFSDGQQSCILTTDYDLYGAGITGMINPSAHVSTVESPTFAKIFHGDVRDIVFSPIILNYTGYNSMLVTNDNNAYITKGMNQSFSYYENNIQVPLSFGMFMKTDLKIYCKGYEYYYDRFYPTEPWPQYTGLPTYDNVYLDNSKFKRFNNDGTYHNVLYVGNGSTLQNCDWSYRQNLVDSGTKFYAVCPDGNKSIGQYTYNDLATSTGGKVFSTLDEAVAYITQKNSILNDSRKSGYIVKDEDELIYNKSFSDYERDSSNKNDIYAERWKYNHDNSVFENDQGVINGNNTWSLTSKSLVTNKPFNKVGSYVISYQGQDNPSLNNKAPDGTIPDSNKFLEYNALSLGQNQLQVYVNRRPIAQYAYSVNSTSLSVNNTSFDLDHKSSANKGIAINTWKYKKLDDTGWTISSTPPTTLDPSSTYILSLQVKDVDGFISRPYTQILGAQLNNPPTALFKLDTNQITKGSTNNNITDESYDTENDPLVEYDWWITDSLGLTIVKEHSQDKPDLSTLNKGDYIVHLKVRDDPSARGNKLPSLWSEEYTQPLQVGINNPPIADFLMNPIMYKGDINNITDKSYDPDGDSIGDRHWYILDSTGNTVIQDCGGNKPNLSSLDIGSYKIKLVVQDIPAWGLPLTSDPCIKDLTILDKNAVRLDVDANPTSSNWTNKDITPTISVIGGYNYRYTQYAWSTSTVKPSDWSGTSTDRTFPTTQSQEGIWYLHMNATDELSSVYKYRGPYKIDKTPPDIEFTLTPGIVYPWNNEGVLQVKDALSGVNIVYYQWMKTDEKQNNLWNFKTWGGEVLSKPEGSGWYLHAQAVDNAGNHSYKVFGPYHDPLKLVNFRIKSMVNPPQKYTFPITLPDMPANCKSGYNNTFEINVEGIADTITVHATDNTGKDLGKINMTKEYDIDSTHSVWTFDYATNLNTPKGTIIKFDIVGEKDTMIYYYNTANSWDGSTLKIIGNALEDAMIFRRY